MSNGRIYCTRRKKENLKQKANVSCTAKGLILDPTEDYDADEFDVVMKEKENVSKYGIRGHSCLLPSDAKHILKAQRLGYGLADENYGITGTLHNSSTMYTLLGECQFVPDVAIAWFVTFFPDGKILQRLLSQTWVSTWQGWEDFNKREITDGNNFNEEIWVDDLLQKFLKISLEDVIINFVTDDKRKKELCNSRDMEMQVGDSFGMNCLADSLLQCLLFHNMIDATQEDISDVHWRRRLCARAREFVCQQSDDWLRPRQKDEHNGIRTVAQDEHDKAFLEHQRHAKVIVMYFLDNFGKQKYNRRVVFV